MKVLFANPFGPSLTGVPKEFNAAVAAIRQHTAPAGGFELLDCCGAAGSDPRHDAAAFARTIEAADLLIVDVSWRTKLTDQAITDATTRGTTVMPILRNGDAHMFEDLFRILQSSLLVLSVFVYDKAGEIGQYFLSGGWQPEPEAPSEQSHGGSAGGVAVLTPLPQRTRRRPLWGP